MNCIKIRKNLHNFQDKTLSDQDRVAFQLHLDHCPQCQEAMRQEDELLSGLRSLPVPQPSPDFVTRSFATARAKHRKQRIKQQSPYWGGALAACLALLLMIAGPFNHSMPEGLSVRQEINLKIDEQRLVQVVVHVPREMLLADVVIELPSQVEVAGFPGLRELRWNTTLHKGKNLLTLPLIARAGGSVQLITHISHESKSKMLSFVMNISHDELSENGQYKVKVV